MEKHTIFVIFCLVVAHLVAADFNFVALSNLDASDFAALGSSKVNASGIKITEQSDPSGSVVLFNQPLPLANGFTTTFILDITNCDVPYGGADGFAFVMFPNIPPKGSVFAGGSSLGITTLSNLVAIPFLLGQDTIGICALNSSTTLGGLVSVTDNLQLCKFNNTVANALKTLRCSGPHTFVIKYTVPDLWEISVDSSISYSFTRNTSQILDWNYQAYVGFSGGVAQGYMNQYVTSWSLSLTQGCLGICDPVATCNVGTTVTCTCPSGYQGDGATCTPIDPPSATVIPILECFEDLGAGSYRAHFGYQNDQNEAVVISEGPNNRLIGSSSSNLLTSFNPGRSPYYPVSAFKHEFNNTNVITWHLTDYEVAVDVTDKTKLCPQDLLRLRLLFYAILNVDTGAIVAALTEQSQVSYGRIKTSNFTLNIQNKKRSSVVGDLELEIAAANSTAQGEPSAAETVVNLVDTSQNTTRMNEILNEGQGQQLLDFITTKTVATGVETTGQPISPPNSPPTAVPSSSNVPTAATPVKATSEATMQLLNCFALLISLVLAIIL